MPEKPSKYWMVRMKGQLTDLITKPFLPSLYLPYHSFTFVGMGSEEGSPGQGTKVPKMGGFGA